MIIIVIIYIFFFSPFVTVGKNAATADPLVIFIGAKGRSRYFWALLAAATLFRYIIIKTICHAGAIVTAAAAAVYTSYGRGGGRSRGAWRAGRGDDEVERTEWQLKSAHPCLPYHSSSTRQLLC